MNTKLVGLVLLFGVGLAQETWAVSTAAVGLNPEPSAVIRIGYAELGFAAVSARSDSGHPPDSATVSPPDGQLTRVFLDRLIGLPVSELSPEEEKSVPVPPALWMCVSGLIGLVIISRRRYALKA
jgi:hypothetical protein